jgi:cyclopropane fatty-acyl-phospholipid synthase-like methyltransferase
MYLDFWKVDTMNVTRNSGLRWFMDTFKPGKRIVDIGAGYGGPSRVLMQDYQAEVTGLEYLEVHVDFGNMISRILGLHKFLEKLMQQMAVSS